jgi:hypothetical protein
MPSKQPTREATELLHVLREWSAQSGYTVWREQDAAALIDRFAAQHSTAERAEVRRAALEEAMRRLTRICIDEAPEGMTQAQAANWAIGIARDEINALVDTPPHDTEGQ